MGTNCQIARLFSEIALMLEICDSNPFKIRAYKNVADSISGMETDLSDMSEAGRNFTEIKGIGKDISLKIKEFFDTGSIEYHAQLRSEVGDDVLELLKIRGVGVKMARLFSDSGISCVDELERRLKSGSLNKIQGIGGKKAQAILEAVDFYKSNLSVYGLGRALSVARTLCEEISLIDGVCDVRPIGGLRRMRETVAEIELLVSLASDKNASYLSLFFNSLSTLSHIKSVERDAEEPKAVLSTKFEIRTVVYATPHRDFIFNLVKLTGSKSHWEKLLSVKKDEFPLSSGGEKDFYRALGLSFIPPELREDRGEIEAAKRGALPELVELTDIRGDLHTHTSWSDGKNSVEQMAVRAREMGYEYIALTDHSPSSAVANGLSAERLARKIEEVRKVNFCLDKIEVLTGAEVDIKPDGSLDYPDEVLSELDFVVVSVHSSFSMEPDLMAKRITRALENPFVHALGHPTARIIGKRAPCRMDMEKVMDAAAQNGKCLEINSSCQRLDLKDEHVSLALEKGVDLIISTDAHSVKQLGTMVCGVAVARRGWAQRTDFLNTLPLKDLLARLKDDR